MRIGYFLSSEEWGPRDLAGKSQHSDRVLARVR